jgi:hypothetical protein
LIRLGPLGVHLPLHGRQTINASKIAQAPKAKHAEGVKLVGKANAAPKPPSVSSEHDFLYLCSMRAPQFSWPATGHA